MLFSFNKKKIYNYFRDYLKKLTKEQKEIFDRENPYWAQFRSSDKKTKESLILTIDIVN